LHTKARVREIRSRNTVLNAVQAILEPLARLLIENGVSSPVAESLLRAVYVHEAAKIRPPGRNKANVSRVALITGVDRGEVARILRTPPAEDPALETRLHRANRVLAGWHLDPRFSGTGDGAPLVLPIKSIRRKPSFWALARRYAPGVYPGLVLSELCRVGAAERRSDGRVRVRTREYKAKALSDRSLNEIGSRARELLQAIVRNDTDHTGIDQSPRTRPPKRRRPSREGRHQ